MPAKKKVADPELKDEPVAEKKSKLCGHMTFQGKLVCILEKGHEGDHFSDQAVNAYWGDMAGEYRDA